VLFLRIKNHWTVSDIIYNFQKSYLKKLKTQIVSESDFLF